MKKLLLLALLLLIAPLVRAQTQPPGIFGPITSGDCTKWHDPGNLQDAGPCGSTAVANRPIFAYIAHSYAVRTIPKAEINTVVVSGGNTLTVNSYGGISLSTNYIFRIYGVSSTVDGYYTVATANNGTGVYTASVTGIPNGTYSSSVPGLGWIYDMGTGGATGGYSTNWLSVARMTMGNAFALPPSYVFGVNGGRIIGGQITGDIGLSGWVTALLTKTPKPAWTVIDQGINDCGNNSLSSMESTYLTQVKRLRTANIFVLAAFVLGGSNTTLSVNECARAFNLWLLEQAQAGILYTFDPTKRTLDPTSTTGTTLTRDFDQSDTNHVHLNANGSIDVAHSMSDQYKLILPALKTSAISAADQIDATNNPYGTFTTLSSSIPSGVFQGTAGSINLTGSLQTIGGIQILDFSTNSNTITAAVSARTDTNPDGSTVVGSELVITFPSGTYGSPTGVLIYCSTGSNGLISSGGSTYSASSYIQMESDVEIDTANLSGTPYIPQLNLTEQDGSGNAIVVNTFGDSLAVLNSATPGLAAGSYQLITPAFLTRPASSFIQPAIQLRMAGTTTGAIIYRIRSMSVRNVDPVNGEPF